MAKKEPQITVTTVFDGGLQRRTASKRHFRGPDYRKVFTEPARKTTSQKGKNLV